MDIDLTTNNADNVFLGSGRDGNFGFRVQAESANLGPNSGFRFDNDIDGGRQAGFQGDGYLIFGDETSVGNRAQVDQNDILEYQIFIPEDQTGVYQLQLRSSRDIPGEEGDRQNDVFVNVDGEKAPGGIQGLLVDQDNEPEPVSDGFIKAFTSGPQQNNGFADGNRFDGLPDNGLLELNFAESGVYTIQIAGRSDGYHFDSFDLFKGEDLADDAPDSVLAPNPELVDDDDVAGDDGADDAGDDDAGDGDQLTDGFDVFLVDTNTNERVARLEEGGLIDADLLPDQASIALFAKDDALDFDSITLTNDGQSRTEQVEPFALFGDIDGDFLGGKTFEEGEQTLQVDLNIDDDDDGTIDRAETFILDFEIV